MQPGTGKTVGKPQPQPGRHRQDAERRHELVELDRHQQQTFALGNAVGRHHRQIDVDARQVEQAGEPGNHHPDVQGLHDEHAFLLESASAMPASTVG
ncbi:hypothetical protein SDC9_152244 [bioreactor metagenome]|uniref:Uncharacterized protein n=1 Tax=bioreactor metagenome TaxID=1076179 RepID=A0A645ESK5_9ZZZZ